jgi:voltage-gated potassium channel
MDKNITEKETVERERYEILEQLDRWLDLPMLILGIPWLVLIILDLIEGIGPRLAMVFDVIWVLFIIDFLLEFIIAPRKSKYLKSNWITAISLVVPAFRILRVFPLLKAARIARAGRGLNLIRVLGSVNRGMRTLSSVFSRHGFAYVMGLTVIVTFAGAAGMYAFERSVISGPGLNDFGTALWWTAMIMTTMGSQYWPQTPEGRILCLFLAVYAFSVFGYVTAFLASLFIGGKKTGGE